MKAMWIVLGLVLHMGCVESNPQPSPMAGADTATPWEDTGAAMDGAVVDANLLDTVDVLDMIDAADICACGPYSCGVLLDCDGKNCGLCEPGDFCLSNECILGTPLEECDEDSDCAGDGTCLNTKPKTCTWPCDDDADCPKHLICVEHPRDPDPVFLCIPDCPDTPECGNGSCGFLSDDCGTYMSCGDCVGENEYCGPDNLCVCESEICGEVCCAKSEVCISEVCVSDCDPECGECLVCEAGNCVPVECPPGMLCEPGIGCCYCAWPCGPCQSSADCAPDLTCDGNICRAETDAACDGCDDDGDGETDDDYEAVDDCGQGVCQQANTPSTCLDGIETPCIPGEPLSDVDETCDGLDDDCDGEIDEDANPPCP